MVQKAVSGGELVRDGGPVGDEYTEVKNSSRTPSRSRKRKVKSSSQMRLWMLGLAFSWDRNTDNQGLHAVNLTG